MSQATTDEPSIRSEECIICHTPRDRHNRPTILHEFCGAGQQASLVARSQQSRDAHEGNRQGSNRMPATPSSDAILRMALLRKGIITVEDLDAIEQELKVSGAAFFPQGSSSQGDEHAVSTSDA